MEEVALSPSEGIPWGWEKIQRQRIKPGSGFQSLAESTVLAFPLVARLLSLSLAFPNPGTPRSSTRVGPAAVRWCIQVRRDVYCNGGCFVRETRAWWGSGDGEEGGSSLASVNPPPPSERHALRLVAKRTRPGRGGTQTDRRHLPRFSLSSSLASFLHVSFLNPPNFISFWCLLC